MMVSCSSVAIYRASRVLFNPDMKTSSAYLSRGICSSPYIFLVFSSAGVFLAEEKNPFFTTWASLLKNRTNSARFFSVPSPSRNSLSIIFYRLPLPLRSSNHGISNLTPWLRVDFWSRGLSGLLSGPVRGTRGSMGLWFCDRNLVGDVENGKQNMENLTKKTYYRGWIF